MVKTKYLPKLLWSTSYLLGAAALTALSLSTHRSAVLLTEQYTAVSHSKDIIATAEAAFSFLKNIEISQRAYLLHEVSSYSAFSSSHDSLNRHLQHLRQLTQASPAQYQRAATLQQRVHERLRWLSASSDASLPQPSAGETRLPDIEQAVLAITGTEIQRLRTHTAGLNAGLQRVQTRTIGLATGYALLTLLLIMLLRKQLRRNRAYEQELKKAQEELLQTHHELEASSIELANYNDQLEGCRDQMESRLQERLEEIETDYYHAMKRIEALDATEQQLYQQVQELQQRNQELDNYVYRVAHDLRAPLNSVLGLTDLIRHCPDLLTAKEYNQLIESRVLKLNDFISCVLSQSHSARAELNITKVDFVQIIQECSDELRYLPNRERLSIATQCEGETDFFSDRLRLGIILKNFISNAIKYANWGNTASYLSFHIHITEQQARIVIRDNGIGIGQEHLGKIFDMFYRATEKSEGSGLGLHIVQQNVDLLEGSISVNSTLGEGTTFELTLANFKNSFLEQVDYKE